MPGPRDAARGADPTVTLGRHTLAAALVWHTVAEDSDLLEEVRDLAQGDGGHGTAADLYVPRATAEIPQFALGASADGLRAGQPSLAALLDLVLRDADGGTPDAAGAWRLDDGRYYVFLRRDGAILPDGDALFAREADARDHFLASLTPGGGPWHALHAPEAWSVAGAGTDTLEQVLGNTLPPPRRVAVLRPVASNTMRRAGLAAGVALLVALTAWHQQGRIVDGANALMIRAGVKAQPAPPAPPPPPWAAASDPAVVAARCADAFRALGLSVPGWTPTAFTCDGRDASLAFQRDTAVAGPEWMAAAVRRHGPDGARLTVGGEAERATVRLALERPDAMPRPPAWRQARLRNHLWDVVARAESRGRVRTDRRTLPGREGGPGRTVRALVAEITSPFPPHRWADALARIPGSEIETIQWHGRKEMWSYDARLWHR